MSLAILLISITGISQVTMEYGLDTRFILTRGIDFYTEKVSWNKIDYSTFGMDYIDGIVEVSMGVNIPLYQSRKESSICLTSSLLGGFGFISNHADLVANASLPVIVFYRLGAGSTKDSHSAVGFGVGLGAEANFSYLDLILDEKGLNKVYILPVVALELAFDPSRLQTKFKIQFKASLLTYSDQRHNHQFDVDYGPKINYFSLGLVFFK
ncbi:MAG: hypothetical protein WC341_04215 [Bacteroidales bacterium]